MGPIAYTVIATLPDQPTAAEYTAWLLGGHTEAVVRAGARSAQVVRIEEPHAPICVESRYVFADREALERYLRESAPALRADGLARFPPERGVSFERRVGVVLARVGAPAD